MSDSRSSGEVQYYVRSRGKVLGPFTIEKLKGLRSAGQFSRVDEISSDRETWQSAATLESIFGTSGVAPAEDEIVMPEASAGITQALPPKTSRRPAQKKSKPPARQGESGSQIGRTLAIGAGVVMMLVGAGFLLFFIILPGGAWIKRRLETEPASVKGNIETAAAKEVEEEPSLPGLPKGIKASTILAGKVENQSPPGMPPGARIGPVGKPDVPAPESVRTIAARLADSDVPADEVHIEKSDLSADELTTFKSLSKALWLGLSGRDLSSLDKRAQRGLGGANGIVVASVSPGSPAYEGGIRKGDVLRSIGGKSLTGPEEIEATISAFKPGQTVTAVVMRPAGASRYDRKELKVTLDPVVPEHATRHIAEADLSIEVRDFLTRHILRYASMNDLNDKPTAAPVGRGNEPKALQAKGGKDLVGKNPFDELFRPTFGVDSPIHVGNIGAFRQVVVEAVIDRGRVLFQVQRASVLLLTDTTNLVERAPADLGTAQIVAAVDVTNPKEKDLNKIFIAKPFEVESYLPSPVQNTEETSDIEKPGNRADGAPDTKIDKERTPVGDTKKPGEAVTAAAIPAKDARKKQRIDAVRTFTDTEVTNLERDAMKCRSAADAVDLYREFLAVSDLTPKQKEKALERLAQWQDRVDKQLVRLGTEWVTLDKARETAKAADELIEQAFGRIKQGDFKRAKDLLDKAVKQDPSGVRADWYLGMLNSANFWNYAPAAENNFERAQKRDPENPGICNNLALSRLKMGRWGEALDAWADALRNAPEAPDAVHNLGRFVSEAAGKRIRAGEAQMKRARKIYDKALAEKKGAPSDPKKGWLYSPLALSANERERARPAAEDNPNENRNAKEEPKKSQTLRGSGTGFVVSPGHVLSNRHVAEGGTSYRMWQPAHNKEYDATLVALSADHDLALFKCDDLRAGATPLNIEVPRRSSEIMVLGFPFGERLGGSLKSVRGTVFGLERNVLMIDAMVNPGNSGGPICDDTGRVVAVVYAKANLQALNPIGGGNLGFGIPIEAAMPFLKKSLPDLEPVGDGQKRGWPEVDELISNSVVMVKMYVENLPIFGNPPESRTTNPYEDRTCTACKGRGKVPCPVKGCFKGSIAEFETSYTINGVGRGAQVLQWQTPRNRACPGCQGAGVVDCPHCKNGLDPNLE